MISSAAEAWLWEFSEKLIDAVESSREASASSPAESLTEARSPDIWRYCSSFSFFSSSDFLRAPSVIERMS